MAKEGGVGDFANPTYTQWLLDAIHKVKSQKQRPSDDRICHAVRQVHKVSKDSVLEQLELAVRDGLILRVLNKGICSYRDPKSGPPPKQLKSTQNTDINEIIKKVLRKSGAENGLTLKQIEKLVKEFNSLEFSESTLIDQLKASIRKGISRNVYEKEGKFIKLKAKVNPGYRQILEDDFNSEYSFCFEEENKVCNNHSHFVSQDFIICMNTYMSLNFQEH